MGQDVKQFVLSAKGCSGRGVRMRILDYSQRSQIAAEAAREVGKDATPAEWVAKETVDGIIATVLQITEATGFKKAADLVGDAVKWKKVSADDLTAHLTDYFNVKDLGALDAAFRRYHDVTVKEIDDILGEAQDVTLD